MHDVWHKTFCYMEELTPVENRVAGYSVGGTNVCSKRPIKPFTVSFIAPLS